MAKYCEICKDKVGFCESVKIADGYVDQKCATKVIDKPLSMIGQDITKKLTADKIKEMINSGEKIIVKDIKDQKKLEKNLQKKDIKDQKKLEKNLQKQEYEDLKEEFKQNSDIDCDGKLYIDNKKQKLFIPKKIGQEYQVYNFSDLKTATRSDRFKTNTTTKNKGGITRGIVGGTLMGGAGAIVGASTSKTHGTSSEMLEKSVFVLSFNDERIYQFEIRAGLFSGDKDINIIEVTLNNILEKNKVSNVTDNIESKISYIDELKQLKSLLDDGIITQEEFDNKKKQILG